MEYPLHVILIHAFLCETASPTPAPQRFGHRYTHTYKHNGKGILCCIVNGRILDKNPSYATFRMNDYSFC